MAYKVRHSILVYDKTGKNLLARFSAGVSGDQTSFYRNLKYDYREGVSNIAFEVRVDDPKTEFIQEGNWVEIWRLGEPVRRGVIKPLTPSKDVKWFQVNAFGDGVQWKDYTTPTNWEWWDKWDLADVFRALLWAMEWKTWSDHAHWERCTLSGVQRYSTLDGESDTKNEDIILDVTSDKVVLSTGTIVSDVITRPATAEWYVFQVQDAISGTTSIKYFVRSGSTAIPDSTWSPWAELSRTTSKTKTWSIAAQRGQYVQWKAQLFTTDKESEGPDGMRGHSPMIHAARIVFRYPIPALKEGSLPASFNIPAVDLKPNNENYLEIVKKLCSKYNIHYWFDCDWSDRKTRVNISAEPGVDRSIEPGCIFREGRDFKSLDVQINRNEYCNYLHLYGAGKGLDQLYDFIKDDAEITARGGIVYGKFSDSECNDLATLRLKGWEELHKRMKGKYGIEMKVAGLRYSTTGKLPFNVFDWIYISSPSQKINYKHQIIEMSVAETARGESIGFKLDNKMLSTETVIENIRKKINQEYYEPVNTRIPNPPINVVAYETYRHIFMSCLGPGEAFEWHASTDGVNFNHLKTVNTTHTQHNGQIGQQFWFKVRQLVDGNWSSFSGVVSTILTRVPGEDILRPAPTSPKVPKTTPYFPPENKAIIGNRVTWAAPTATAGETITGAVIRRTEKLSTGEEKVSFFQAPAMGGEYIDTTNVAPGATYQYSIQFQNDWGQQSEFAEATPVMMPTATQTPSTPKGLTATVSLKTVTLSCTPNTDVGIAGYEWKCAAYPATTLEQATVIPGNQSSNSFTGAYGKSYSFWVSAYTILDKKYCSGWAGPVTVQITQVEDGDLHKVAPPIPAKPTVTSAVQSLNLPTAIISNRVQWSAPAGISFVNIQRKEGSVLTHFSAPAAGGVFADEVGIKPATTYEYSIQFVNEWGVSSPAFSPAVLVTTLEGVEKPAKPTGLSASAVCKRVFLRCNLGTDLGLAGYEWRSGDTSNFNPDLATPIAGSKNNTTFFGDYGREYRFWVRSYTIVSGKNCYSDWSDPVTVSMGKLGQEDLDIFIDGTLDPEILSKVFQKYSFNMETGSYTLADPNNSQTLSTPTTMLSTEVEGKALSVIAQDTIFRFASEYPTGVQIIPVEKCVIIPANKQWVGQVIPMTALEINVPLGHSLTQFAEEVGMQFELVESPGQYVEALSGGMEGQSYNVKNLIINARWKYAYSSLTDVSVTPYAQIRWQIVEMPDSLSIGSSIPGTPL